MVDKHETERRRIAEDIHDNSIQAMVAVSMRLQLLGPTLPARQRETVAALHRSVDDAVAGLRNLIMQLRPPELDHRGLLDALTWYVAQVASECQVHHQFHHDLDREPPTDTAVTVFRLTQDSLTFMHQHARVTEAHISVMTRECGLVVVVRGTASNTVDQDLVALLAMRERAEAAGGWFRLDHVLRGKTVLRFWIPVNDTEGESA